MLRNKKTLFIYDKEGFIIQQFGGDYRIPIGIPYVEVEVPKGSYVDSIDVITNQPIFKEYPLSNEDLMTNKIDSLEQGLANVEYALMMGGLI